MKWFITTCVYLYYVVNGLDIPDSTNLSDSQLVFAKQFLDQGYPNSGDIPLLNRKIFKGQRVTIKEHPYVVSIRRLYAHYCTGSILTRNLVITVAHPVVDVTLSDLGVVVGETYANRGTKKHTVILLVVHEDFNPYTLQADLALLLIYEEFIYGGSIKLISLIAPEVSINKRNAFVTGWGRCDITGMELCLPRSSKFNRDEKFDPMLRSISFDIIIPNKFCEAYKQRDVRIKPGMICIGQAREEDQGSPCLGVPGAPLVVNAKLTGILSWGFGCGYVYDMPLVYTSIHHYQAWLVHNVPIVRKLKRNYLTRLFQATRAHFMLDWLAKTRTFKPKLTVQNYTDLKTTRLDRELAKLKGIVYDIRDYAYDGMFREQKRAIYDDMTSRYAQKTSKKYIETIASAIPLSYNKSNEPKFKISDIYVVNDETDKDETAEDHIG